MSQTQNDGAADRGRVILITGAGQGLGRAFAEAWSARGARVVVNDRAPPEGEGSAAATVAALRAAGGGAVADTTDICDPGAGAALLACALAAYGRLDGVILNAGVSGPSGRVEDQADAAFREVMAVNFFANVALAQALLPQLKAAPAGRLLMVSSSAGLYGLHGRAPYAASKAALAAFALTLAKENRRHGLGVNVLTPYAATPMTPPAERAQMSGVLEPTDVAPLAVYLTSTAFDRTGEIWTAGGGLVRRAQMMEGRGDAPEPHTPLTPEWIQARREALGSMTDATGFADAGAAFSDLVSKLRRP